MSNNEICSTFATIGLNFIYHYIWESKMLKSTKYYVVILGSGPAGLQAAIHAARRKVSVLLMGKETKSSLFHAHVERIQLDARVDIRHYVHVWTGFTGRDTPVRVVGR